MYQHHKGSNKESLHRCSYHRQLVARPDSRSLVALLASAGLASTLPAPAPTPPHHSSAPAPLPTPTPAFIYTHLTCLVIAGFLEMITGCSLVFLSTNF